MTVAFPIITRSNYTDYLEYEDFKVLQGNIVKKTDTYNLSHQEAKCNTDWEISHIYARKQGIVLYGFNKLVSELLSTQVTMKMVTSAYAHAIRQGMPFPYDMWKRVVEECDGWIPIEVEALLDGRWCPKGTPFAQVRNTVEGFGELVTWFEAVLLKMAFPSGCMTRAFHMKKYLLKKQIEQGQLDNPLFLWRFHSFGYRGHNSEENAYWAGTAWTTFLAGTDDYHVSWYTRRAVMGSIRALAHKVTQQFNKMSAEEANAKYGVNKALPGDVVAMYRMLELAHEEVGGSRAAALVIDTYNPMKVIDEHVVDLAIYARDHDVHGVFRPDSGDVLEQGIMIYWKLKNAGLEDHCHVIIGEGMSFEQAQKYDERLEQEGIPLGWFFYGIGGGFYKDIDRDWSGSAMKTAYSNGADRMKLVVSAPEKSSIPGAVQLVMLGGVMTIVPEEVAKANHWKSEYVTIYKYIDKDNIIRVKQDLDDIMDLANQQTGEQGRIAMSKEILEKIENFKHFIEEDVA